MSLKFVSWGRFPYQNQDGQEILWRDDPLPVTENFLPQGNARSYGDCCMIADGKVLSTRQLRSFIHFDADQGILRCEPGVTLKDILEAFVPSGWFLPVTPGTQYATVGGAIANDVHGKNHHWAGTFGCHVQGFELLRSNGERIYCSPSVNAEWYAATIGGLGLTGLIVWADIQLRRIDSVAIHMQTHKYTALADFFRLSEESEEGYEYTMAWVDCLSSGRQLGRGHFMRGNHAPGEKSVAKHRRLPLAIPMDLPVSLVNQLTLKPFNALYYHRQRAPVADSTVHYEPFFYPLDGIAHWNRMYGPRGFLQYQCVVPPEVSQEAIGEILKRIARAGAGSFLAVLKVFGSRMSPGMLSFPRPGATLALDFPWQESRTRQLFDSLDDVVRQARGAIYPAKDAHMRGVDFRRYYPRWNEFEQYRDPGIVSSFWKRVMEG